MDFSCFAKKHRLEELEDYLKENAKDFIAYKASLLMEETANDPIAKADLIRDMVNSISKISDQIKQELYVRECARIMDISEAVLFSTLAQMLKKSKAEAYKNAQKETKAFEVVKTTSAAKKVDIQYELEQKIIKSQKRRLFVQSSLLKGKWTGWDHQPFVDAKKAYVRGAIDPNTTATKARKRYPFVETIEPHNPRKNQ